MKAMIMNRIGDFGFALEFLHYLQHSIRWITAIFAQVPMPENGSSWLTVICLLLFVGLLENRAGRFIRGYRCNGINTCISNSCRDNGNSRVYMMIRCSPLFEYASALVVITIFGPCGILCGNRVTSE